MQEDLSRIYFGRNSRYLETIKTRIKNSKDKFYNPDFKFDRETLKNLKERLAIDVIECLELVKKYENKNSDLKDYPHQQYHLYESNLISDYFKVIDTVEKAYWYGFLCADGFLRKLSGRKKKYDLGVEISIKDKDHLIRYCKSLCINLEKIRLRKRIDNMNGKLIAHWRGRVIITCKPLYQDLLNLGFASSKTIRKLAPNFNNEKIMLAWLLGYYDGDGTQGQTEICSSSKEFLEDIKKKFKVKNIVHEYLTKEKTLDSEAHFIYRLRLGTELFIKMMHSYENSMPRKRVYFYSLIHPKNVKKFEILEKEVGTKERLQELVFKYKKIELIKIFNTSRKTLDKLIKKWDIKIPSREHWIGRSNNSFGVWGENFANEEV